MKGGNGSGVSYSRRVVNRGECENPPSRTLTKYTRISVSFGERLSQTELTDRHRGEAATESDADQGLEKLLQINRKMTENPEELGQC